jgi:hypothetical protein
LGQHPSSAPNFTTSQVFIIYFLKCPRLNTIQSYDSNVALNSLFLIFKANLLVKRDVFLLNAAFAMEILNLTSRVPLASFSSNILNTPYSPVVFDLS